MTDKIDDVRVTVTPAAHQWQASLRLVLHIGGGPYFVLLSYADGSTAIHRAIDEQGTVGGDWWGSAYAPSVEECLARFAEEHGVGLEALRAAIDSVAPGVPVAARQDLDTSPEKVEEGSLSLAECRGDERSM